MIKNKAFNLTAAVIGVVMQKEKHKLPLNLAMKVGTTLSATLIVAGCSSLGLGESDFSCPGYPDGVQCMSTHEVYEATNDGNVPRSMDSDGVVHTKGSSNTAQQQNVPDPARNPVGSYVAPNLPNRPIPIRTPAEVMRIWIAPWEDTNGDLNVTGYVYTEIEPRRWTIADTAPKSSPVLTPLSVKGARNKTSKKTEQIEYHMPSSANELEEGADDLDSLN